MTRIVPDKRTATFAADVGLDSASIYAILPGGSAPAALVATMKGGSKFDPGITYRDLDFDGKRTPNMGDDRVSKFDSKITGKVLSVEDTFLEALNIGSTHAGTLTITPQAASQLIPGSAYWTDVRLYGARGDGKVYCINFYDGAMVKWTLGTSDNGEAEIDLTIEARLDNTRDGMTQDDCPFKVLTLAAFPTAP